MGTRATGENASSAPPASTASMPFSHHTRPALMQRQANEHFDLLVVGGGITGAGIARDASLRGLRVALVEQGDFGSGTSSKSSKLIHGGLRYLEQLQLGLVFEATNERSRLMRHAPHLVRPLPFLFPIFRGKGKGPLVVGMGLWIYDALAMFRNYKVHRRLDASALEVLEPLLGRENLRAAMLYYDAMTDDARLTLENVIAAHRAGAAALSYARFDEATRGAKGKRVTGGIVRDRFSNRTWPVSAETVVFSAGPWTDLVRRQLPEGSASMMRPTKGVHIVVPRDRLPLHHAVVMTSIRDGRVVFALPWEESTAIGTTDTDYSGSPDDVAADYADVEYLVETTRHYFPAANLRTEDVISTWAGLRPLVRDDAGSAYATSREHTIVAGEDHTVTIAGGKLTTYRRMASECVDAAIELLPRERRAHVLRSPTAHTPLPAGDGLDVAGEEAKVQAALEQAGITSPGGVAEHLVHTYGLRWPAVLDHAGERPPRRVTPHAPVLDAELRYSMGAEMVLTLEDFMVRRTHLHYHLRDQGEEVAVELARQCASELGWSAEREHAELRAYFHLVAQNRRWKTDMQSSTTAVSQPEGHARSPEPPPTRTK